MKINKPSMLISYLLDSQQLQLRAVSSPSLSDGGLEGKQRANNGQQVQGGEGDAESAVATATADFPHIDNNCATIVEVLGNEEIYETVRNHSSHEDDTAPNSGQGE